MQKPLDSYGYMERYLTQRGYVIDSPMFFEHSNRTYRIAVRIDDKAKFIAKVGGRDGNKALVELVLLIWRSHSNISVASAAAFVLGYWAMIFRQVCHE